MTRLHVWRPTHFFVQEYVWLPEADCTHARLGTTACERCWPKKLRGDVLLEVTED